MDFQTLIAFNLVLVAALVSPGPAFVMITKTVISRGLVAGIKFGIGLGTMAALWTASALLGLQTLFAIFPWAYLAMKTVGGLYLLYIAWQTFIHARDPIDEGSVSAKRDFFDGMLVNLANPKSVLFAGSVLALVFPPNLLLLEKAAIVTNHLAVEIIFYTALALAFGNPFVRSRFMKTKVWFDRISGALMAALGLKLLIQR